MMLLEVKLRALSDLDSGFSTCVRRLHIDVSLQLTNAEFIKRLITLNQFAYNFVTVEFRLQFLNEMVNH